MSGLLTPGAAGLKDSRGMCGYRGYDRLHLSQCDTHRRGRGGILFSSRAYPPAHSRRANLLRFFRVGGFHRLRGAASRPSNPSEQSRRPALGIHVRPLRLSPRRFPAFYPGRMGFRDRPGDPGALPYRLPCRSDRRPHAAARGTMGRRRAAGELPQPGYPGRFPGPRHRFREG